MLVTERTLRLRNVLQGAILPRIHVAVGVGELMGQHILYRSCE